MAKTSKLTRLTPVKLVQQVKQEQEVKQGNWVN